MNKCIECRQVKGKRRCLASGELICSKCCGQKRSWAFCNTSCEFFPLEVLNYTPYNSQSFELTRLPDGLTTKFEVPLFLPNLFDVITCTVKELRIDLLDFNKAVLSIRFKLDGNRELVEKVYEKDSWKVLTSNVPNRNGNLLAPLIILSTSIGGSSNNIEAKTKYGESNLSLVKTSYSLNIWLPHATSSTKKIDVREKPEFKGDYVSAVVHQGRFASKKNDVFWGELNTKFDYNMSFQIDCSDINIKKRQLSMFYLGYLLPYKKISVESYVINKSESFSLSEDSFLALQTFGEQEDVRLWEIPLEQNFGNAYHAGHIKHLIANLPESYHYDEYLYADYFFFLENRTEISVNLLFNSDNIVSAYFNNLREVYNGKYSPILLILANMSQEIKKVKVVYEVKGLSERSVDHIYLEPLKTFSTPIFPTLDEGRLNNLPEHSSVQFFVEVFYNDVLLYEESKVMNLLPKETFIFDSEDLGKAYKYYFYSFLARWVTPNAKAVENLINEAANKVGALEGISQDINKVMVEVGALYDVIASKIKYVSKTFSLYKGQTALHQKVHLPRNTIANGGGNCIDLAILMASCLEKLAYEPQIIIIPEHAYLGIKFDDFSIYIELTCVGENSFIEAVKEGNRIHDIYFDENNQGKKEKCIIVNIAEARKVKIYPMN